MFQAREFVFAGLPSSYFGLYCCDFGSTQHQDNAFGNKAKIIEERINDRVRPLHFGVNYHDEPLTFTMIFGGDEPFDRHDMQAISKWLTGYQQYQWLKINQPDMQDVVFRCLIRELTPISVGWFPYAFSAEVICDCPYAYSNEFEQSYDVQSGDIIMLRNLSTAREILRPVMTIDIPSGTKSFSLTNKSNGNQVFAFTGLPGGALHIVIDNETGIITETTQGLDMYPYFNFNFFEMALSDNFLFVEGDAKVTFTGRYLMNVGA